VSEFIGPGVVPLLVTLLLQAEEDTTIAAAISKAKKLLFIKYLPLINNFDFHHS